MRSNLTFKLLNIHCSEVLDLFMYLFCTFYACIKLISVWFFSSSTVWQPELMEQVFCRKLAITLPMSITTTAFSVVAHLLVIYL